MKFNYFHFFFNYEFMFIFNCLYINYEFTPIISKELLLEIYFINYESKLLSFTLSYYRSFFDLKIKLYL